MINNTKVMIGPALILVTVLTALTGCSSSGGGETAKKSDTPTPKTVKIAAPKSADVGKTQVRVSGPPGTKVDIYGYNSGWKKKPKCTGVSGSDPLRSVKLDSTGKETLDVPVKHAGVWWWVVSATKKGLTSECGDVSTIAKNKPEFVFGGPNSPRKPLTAEVAQLPAGKPATIWVQSDITAPDPVGKKGWPVTVRWYGPYTSIPEARAGCHNKKDAPIAVNKKATAKHTEPGGKLTVTPKKTGVYTVIASTPETKWNAAASSGCNDNTPLIEVK